jgi:hypothetical protein
MPGPWGHLLSEGKFTFRRRLREMYLVLSKKVFKIPQFYVSPMFIRGARYLTGEKLKAVWAEFSTLS